LATSRKLSRTDTLATSRKLSRTDALAGRKTRKFHWD
jgi:hypothetical protein